MHGATSELLLEDAPPDYLCPISKQLMVQPVMLVETGHTYEAASIHKWLATHDVCPLNGRKLINKQTTPNYALKRLIADWAAAHSITLPPAASMHSSSYSSAQTTPGATIAIDVGSDPGREVGKGGVSGPCRCTRTRWALGAIVVLLIVAAGIGLGVGLPLVMRRTKGDSCLLNQQTYTS